MERKPIFNLGTDLPTRSEVIAAWNRLFPERQVTPDAQSQLLSQLVAMMRQQMPLAFEFEINKMRGHGYDAVLNTETQRYEVVI